MNSDKFKEKRYSVVAEFKDGHITGYENIISFLKDISQRDGIIRAEIDLEHKLSFDDYFHSKPIKHLLG